MTIILTSAFLATALAALALDANDILRRAALTGLNATAVAVDRQVNVSS